MTNNKGIFIKNIYYMLTYAFHVLKQSNYDEIAAEEFENIQDLFAAILAKGIARQLKQGLYREYISECENLSVMRGKLNIYGTINNKLQRKQVLWRFADTRKGYWRISSSPIPNLILVNQ
jgi:5-methylcytosine-specific restriction enzyme subunit McrC